PVASTPAKLGAVFGLPIQVDTHPQPSTSCRQHKLPHHILVKILVPTVFPFHPSKLLLLQQDDRVHCLSCTSSPPTLLCKINHSIRQSHMHHIHDPWKINPCSQRSSSCDKSTLPQPFIQHRLFVRRFRMVVCAPDRLCQFL